MKKKYENGRKVGRMEGKKLKTEKNKLKFEKWKGRENEEGKEYSKKEENSKFT